MQGKQGKKVHQGKKTHEQQLRTFERKPDVPDARQMEAELKRPVQDDRPRVAKRNIRETEFPVSRGGLHQESDHNKHNDPGQTGHKPQKHSPSEEKD
jgi:hypothetical protein